MFSGNGRHKKEINFWVMPNAGFATRRVLEKQIQDFEAEHPEIKVKLSIHPWSLSWSRMIDVIKGKYAGETPDVLQVGTTWVATLAHLGALEKVPSSNVLPKDDRQSAYIWDPGAQAESGQDLFCVPWFIDVRVLYYRKDVFEKIRIKPELLQDWKGFFRVCLEIKNYLSRSGPLPTIMAPLGIPGQKPGVLMHDLAPWIWGAGGDFCSEDLMSSSALTPQAVKGCEFYFDLINQRFMPFFNGGDAHKGRQGNFFTGHFAMQFSGAWPVDTYLNPESPLCVKEVQENFGVVMVPAGPEGRFTFLGGSNLAVSALSEKKDAAWELVRFLGMPERQLSHARGIGALTARLISLEALFEKYPEPKKVFWDSLGHARRLPRLIELGSVEQIILKMGSKTLEHIVTNKYNHRKLHDEMAKAESGINAVLSLHRYGNKGTGVII